MPSLSRRPARRPVGGAGGARRALACLLLCVPAVLLTAPPATAAATAAATTAATTAVTATSVGPAAVVAAGSPGGQAFTLTAGMLNVLDGPSGTHAVTLDYDIYRPASATAATPQPVIIATNGFGLSKSAAELTTLASFLASHGYVVLTWSAQGFGRSGGCVRLDSVDYDVRDAQAFLDLLQTKDFVARDAVGVRAGIVGGSYGGGLDASVAEVDPRIRALVPGRTWNALQYSLAPNNLVDPADPTGFDHLRSTTGIFKQQWTSLFFASGNAGPAMGAGGCPQEKLTSGDPAGLLGVACPGFALEVCRTFASVTTTKELDPDSRALLARASSGAMIDRLRVPTLLQQGQSDTLFNLNEAMATYTALQRRGVPVGFLWNDGGHGGYDSQPGEGEEYDGTTADKGRSPAEMDALTIPRAQLAWLDHWLRGLDVGVVGFSWFRDYAPNAATPTGASAYTSAPALPVAPDTVLALSGTGALAAPGVAPAAGMAPFTVPPGGLPPAYSETSNFSGPSSQPSFAGVPPMEVAGQNVAFTAAPFGVDTESVGFPSLHLHLTHLNPAADVVFFGKVYDVASDGSRQLIRRLVAPVRVPAAQAAAAVDAKLLGFAHVFRAGHALQVVLASTDAAYAVPGLPDVVTVVTGGADPSRLALPLRPLVATAPIAAAPQPVSGVPGAAPRPARAARRAVPVRRVVGHLRRPVAQPVRTLAFTGAGALLPVGGALLVAAAALAARRRRKDLPLR